MQIYRKKERPIQEEPLSVNEESCKVCSRSTDIKLPLGGLSTNRMIRITDPSYMTSAVYHGRKATNQTNKQNHSLSGFSVSINSLKVQ